MILPKDIITPAIGLSDQYFDLPGLSSYCGLAIPTLRDHLKKGQFPYFKVKGKILVKRSEFDKAMEKKFRVNRPGDLRRLVDETVEQLKRAKKQ